MPISSKYAGKCTFCGKAWNEGDQIETNGLKNTKGKDAWCIDGKQCEGASGHVVQTSNTTNLGQAVLSTQGGTSDHEKIDFARKALTAFIAELAGNQIEPEGCRDSFGAVFNTALMNKK